MKLADYPVIIVLWGSSTCDHCAAFLPRFRELAAEHPHVPVLAVDCHAYPAAANHFGIQETPTVMRISYGREITRLIGPTKTQARALFR
jgi:thioredoxin-like negative regulator of GroEL